MLPFGYPRLCSSAGNLGIGNGGGKQGRGKERRRYDGNSVSTPFLRTPFPRLLKKGLKSSFVVLRGEYKQARFPESITQIRSAVAFDKQLSKQFRLVSDLYRSSKWHYG